MSNEETKEKDEQMIVKSYYIVKTLMIGSLIILIILSLFIQKKEILLIIYLEIFITTISSILYTIFIKKIQYYQKNQIPVSWNDISKTRYFGWMLTTPAMLTVLCLVLAYNSKTVLHSFTLFSIILLDLLMLLFGYLGELHMIDKIYAMVLGFIPFIAMFSIIYMKFIQKNNIFVNQLLFVLYLLFWSIYGIVYIIDEKYKNIITNVLDFVAKGLIGMGISVYYL